MYLQKLQISSLNHRDWVTIFKKGQLTASFQNGLELHVTHASVSNFKTSSKDIQSANEAEQSI